jgi:hypothetical protein
MILSQEAQSSFTNGNFRGFNLNSESFETKRVDLVNPGNTIHAFVVAPTTSFTAKLSGQQHDIDIPAYNAYGVFALDQASYERLQDLGELNLLQNSFNRETSGISNVFLTGSEASKRADQLNDFVYDSYLKDLQTGKLDNISGWDSEENKSFMNSKQSASKSIGLKL